MIILYSMRLDLYGKSKIDTQETSLNVASMSSLVTFDKQKHYVLALALFTIVLQSTI